MIMMFVPVSVSFFLLFINAKIKSDLTTNHWWPLSAQPTSRNIN